ncbi:MAG: tRNA (adenine-N1)-methyltransferase [Candidatus Aenigmarchaeota archaeon]|nr:tRNA (adenine-N1)-methyltransferase [Candidatus Aenigmarchaeota archaeon]
MEKITPSDKVLLLGESTFLVDVGKGLFHTNHGTINLSKLVGKKFGARIKSSKGVAFHALRPNINDFLQKRLARLPQIVSLKDCSLIAGLTGLSSGYRVIEAGTGSAFLTTFMANLVKPDGKVFTYELRSDFFRSAKINVEDSGLSRWVEMKNRDVSKGFREKDADLIVLDMIGAEKIVPKAGKSLKSGGFLAVYSPYIEQVKAVCDAIEMESFMDVRTVECLVRDYKITRDFSRPNTTMLAHTGYITFARKV